MARLGKIGQRISSTLMERSLLYLLIQIRDVKARYIWLISAIFD
ncbi:hypothetical protein [Nostoc sp. PCC 7107]|nr:hypothetical protein [Nostoc sp. PCC 7107]AFY44278.1 hypothetical protein Nos7107_3713 [Nostoc sp. PCC 7107]